MGTYSNPAAYWENRLRDLFNLQGVGYINLGANYNKVMYEVRLQRLVEALQEHTIDLKGKSILEIGCGTGFYTEFFSKQQVASYTGVDITKVSVESLARRYPDFTFLQADIGEVEFPLNKKFDIIFIADVFFHIVDDERFNRAVAHLCESLALNGYLILSDLLLKQPLQVASHVRFRNLLSYKINFDKHGVDVVGVKPIFAILQPPVRDYHTSWLWQGYALFGQYILYRIVHWKLLDHIIPTFLRLLDQQWFVPKYGTQAPNSKWLIAEKTRAS